jgi:acetyl-CoA carboxylase carboxyltransferase component
MSSVADRLKELKDKEKKLKAMGGPERVEKQHKSGKLTARERLDQLFDPGSFHELDLFVQHRATLFGMDKVTVPAEGVITGYGTVNGRAVCAFSQDFTSMGGTLGEMHAKKICKVMDLAMKCGVPIVGFMTREAPGFKRESTPFQATGRYSSGIRRRPELSPSSQQSWGLQPAGPSIRRP